MTKQDCVYGVLTDGIQEPLLVLGVCSRLRRCKKSRPKHSGLGAKGQYSRHSARIGNSSGSCYGCRVDCIHDLRHQCQCGDNPSDVSARLESLRDNHVYACLRRSPGVLHGTNLMNHQYARVMRASDIGRRIAPEERQSCNLFFQSCGNLLLDRKVQQEIHAKRLVGEIPRLVYLLAQSGGGAN